MNKEIVCALVDFAQREKQKTKDRILSQIDKLEPFNNGVCPEWVKNIIRGA